MPRFTLRRSNSAAPARRRVAPGKRRRAFLLLFLLALLCALPAVLFQWNSYQRNIRATRQAFPAPAPLTKTDRVLVISPHCDDETLGAGGLIAHARNLGAAVRVAFVTNGDGSRSTQVVKQSWELRANIQAALGKPQKKETGNLFQRIAAMRRIEALEACRVLGVAHSDVLFLGYPDGGLRMLWETHWDKNTPYLSPYTKTSQSPYPNSYTPGAKYSGAQVITDLEKIIREFRPTLILTTHPEDTHVDHWASYAFTAAALENLRLSPNGSTRVMAGRARLRGFPIHHGIWPAPHGYHPDAPLAPSAPLLNSGTIWRQQPLTEAERESKKDALERYVSQLVFTPHYLRAFVRKNELFGEVPPHTLDSKLKTQNSKLLLKDASPDSLWRERFGAADIRALNAQVSNGVLRLHAELPSAPSARVKYDFALHVADGKNLRAYRLETRQEAGQWKTLLSDRSGSAASTLTARASTRAMEIAVPLKTLELPNTPAATLLVSASTQALGTRIDQTATAVVRIK